MAIGVGHNSYLGVAKETTYGVGVAPATFIEYTDESIANTINPITSGALVGSRFKNSILMSGIIDIGGNFKFEANPDNVGLIIGAALGSETTTQVGTTTAYDHVITPADSLPSLSIEIGRDVKVSRYAGCVIDGLTFNADINSILSIEAAIKGASENDSVSAATASYSSKLPYIFTMGTIKIDTVTVAYVKNLSLSLANNLFGDRYVLNGSQERVGLQPQGSQVTGSMELEFTSDGYAQRTKYLNGTAVALQIIFTSTEEIETGYYYTLTIDVPYIKYQKADANVGGPDVIPFSVDFEAYQPSGDIMTVTLRDARTTNWIA